jgi:hypothetical protein
VLFCVAAVMKYKTAVFDIGGTPLNTENEKMVIDEI